MVRGREPAPRVPGASQEVAARRLASLPHDEPVGAALAAQAKPGDAERLLIDGMRAWPRRRAEIPHHRKKEVQTAAARVVQLYESTGQSDKAAEWRTKIAQRGKPSG